MAVSPQYRGVSSFMRLWHTSSPRQGSWSTWRGRRCKKFFKYLLIITFLVLSTLVFIAMKGRYEFFKTAQRLNHFCEREQDSISPNSLELLYTNQYEQSSKWQDFAKVQTVTDNLTFHYHPITKSKRKENITVLYLTTFFGMENFGRGFGYEPFRGCEYDNCQATNDPSKYFQSDAVLFHACNLPWTFDPQLFPKCRPQYQRWVFYNYESPVTVEDNCFLNLKSYNNVFNLTMGYKVDGDIFDPNFRLPKFYVDRVRKNDFDSPEALVESRFDYAASKTKEVAWVVTNCYPPSKRWDYVQIMKQHVNVDIFGRCSNWLSFARICAPQRGYRCRVDYEEIKKYKFYIAFENSLCSDYLSEKLSEWGYELNVVPIIRGARPSEVARLLPPLSYINADDFDSPKELASYLKYLSNNSTAYNEYFKWRWTPGFKTPMIHGLESKGVHVGFCKLCRMLNHNKEIPKKSIFNLDGRWSKAGQCWTPNLYQLAG